MCSNFGPKFTYINKTFTPLMECLKQKEFKQYSVKLENIEMELFDQDPNMTMTNLSIVFGLKFATKLRNIYEEVLIFDDIDLLGSMGGTLGIFIGFSIFGYIITFLDFILDKWAELKNAG